MKASWSFYANYYARWEIFDLKQAKDAHILLKKKQQQRVFELKLSRVYEYI